MLLFFVPSYSQEKCGLPSLEISNQLWLRFDGSGGPCSHKFMYKKENILTANTLDLESSLEEAGGCFSGLFAQEQ